MSTPLTVYAKKNSNGTVSIYRNKDGTNLFVLFASWASRKPTRRNKWIILNCYRWRLEWIGAKTGESPLSIQMGEILNEITRGKESYEPR